MKLINAIISEDKEAFVQSFRESMAEKVNAVLEAKKVEVASTLLVSEEVEQIDETYDANTHAKKIHKRVTNPRNRDRINTDREIVRAYKAGRGGRDFPLFSSDIEKIPGYFYVDSANGGNPTVSRIEKGLLAAHNAGKKSLREEVEQIGEVKQFRTAYGWAGGRNERTGSVHKMNPGGPNAFQAIASHFKQHLKTNYGLKKAKHENQVGQHMHWIDTNSDGPLDHEGIIAAAKQLDPNAQTSIETRTNKLGPGYGDSEGTHHNTLLTIKGQYKNKPFELTHSNSSWEPGKYEPGQLRLSIHKNELSRAGMDQGVVRR